MSPVGEKGLPLTYSIVLLSTATSPTLAPASIDILQSVILPSILISWIVSPQNSIAYPVPPAVPIFPIMYSARSFALTFLANSPLISIFIFLALFCQRHPVASTCSTSEVPIPNASAPRAP